MFIRKLSRPEIATEYVREILESGNNEEISKPTFEDCKEWCDQHDLKDKEYYYTLYDYRHWIFTHLVSAIIFDVYKNDPRKYKAAVKVSETCDHFCIDEFEQYAS